ncbi:MAG TPA: ABC transporter permease, partial [bacterium]|nr:ABC transporter permease [bacterium]
MVKNFLIVAMRTMRKHKSYTIMNVTGLATGLACFMVIAMYVRRETAFDTFHKNPDRLFRVALYRENTGSPQPIATVSHSVADILRRESPGIESMARLFRFDQDAVILAGEKKFTEPDLMFAEPDVFDLLSIELLNGSPANALKNPTDAVLSEASARAYFGHTDVIGQSIRVRINTRYADFKITGVFKNYPSNSHFYTNVLLGFDGVKNYVGDVDFFQSWFNYPMWTYLRIKDIQDEVSVNAALHQIVERHFPQTRKPAHMQLQRITDIHLHSQMSGEIRPNSNIFYIYTFTVIGLLLLIVACVNYINLSTAQSEQRTREVGVRKVMGARRRELIFQFLMESVLQSMLALG